MKHTIPAIIFIFALTGCAFDTQGERIGNYAKPHKALLVLDIQKDFTGDAARMPVETAQAARMIANVNSLIHYFDDNGEPVIYIRNVFPKKDFIANLFRNNAAVENSPGIEFDTRLFMANDHIFDKSEPDAFSNAGLERYLIENNVSELFITGVFADQCVFWTSKGAMNRGYEVNYIKDAVASGSIKRINNAIARIERDGATVRNTNDIVENR